MPKMYHDRAVEFNGLSLREQVLNGKRIGIFGKGGSGKSSVTVLLAKALKKSGYDVCVLDADSTNIGLAQALGIEKPPAPLLDYFGGAVTYPMDDPMPLIGADLAIDDLPEAYYGRSPDGIQFFMAGKMGDKGPGARCDRPIAEIVRDFRPRYEGQQPVTLVDFRAGFEDSTRRSIVNLDWIVVVIDPTMAAVQMAINMQEMVNQIRVGGRVFFVLNRVQDALTERFLRVRLAEEGIEPLGVIPETPALSMAWLMGEPVIKTPAQEEAEWIIKQLETAVNHTTLSADKCDEHLESVAWADYGQNNPSSGAWQPRSGRNVAVAGKRPSPESYWY